MPDCFCIFCTRLWNAFFLFITHNMLLQASIVQRVNTGWQNKIEAWWSLMKCLRMIRRWQLQSFPYITYLHVDFGQSSRNRSYQTETELRNQRWRHPAVPNSIWGGGHVSGLWRRSQKSGLQLETTTGPAETEHKTCWICQNQWRTPQKKTNSQRELSFLKCMACRPLFRLFILCERSSLLWAHCDGAIGLTISSGCCQRMQNACTMLRVFNFLLFKWEIIRLHKEN